MLIGQLVVRQIATWQCPLQIGSLKSAAARVDRTILAITNPTNGRGKGDIGTSIRNRTSVAAKLLVEPLILIGRITIRRINFHFGMINRQAEIDSLLFINRNTESNSTAGRFRFIRVIKRLRV